MISDSFHFKLLSGHFVQKPVFLLILSFDFAIFAIDFPANGKDGERSGKYEDSE